MTFFKLSDSGSDRPTRLVMAVILVRYTKKYYFYDKSKTTGKFENITINDFLGTFLIYNFAFGRHLPNLPKNGRKFDFCEFLGQKFYFKPVTSSR